MCNRNEKLHIYIAKSEIERNSVTMYRMSDKNCLILMTSMKNLIATTTTKY